MGFAQVQPIGFTTTPLVQATKSSFWTPNFVPQTQIIDTLALANLVLGNSGKQAEQPRQTIGAHGNPLLVGGSHRLQAVENHDAHGTGGGTPEQYSATNLPSALMAALDAERPNGVQTREGTMAFLDLSDDVKEAVLRSDVLRQHPSQFFRDCLQFGTLAPILRSDHKRAFANLRWLFAMADRGSEVSVKMVVAAARLGGVLRHPAIAYLANRNEWDGVIEILKDAENDQEAIVDTLLHVTKSSLGPRVRRDVWDTARSVLPVSAWLTRWSVEQRIKDYIEEQRAFTAQRRGKLSNIRHEKLTSEGAVRTLRNDNPPASEITAAIDEISTLPDEIILSLLGDVVRVHPSRALRSAVQNKITSMSFKPEIYEAAAMIDGKYTNLAFKKLVGEGEWKHVERVLIASDTRSREDLVWILFKERKKTPKHVATVALQTLSPLAFLLKYLMSKLV